MKARRMITLVEFDDGSFCTSSHDLSLPHADPSASTYVEHEDRWGVYDFLLDTLYQLPLILMTGMSVLSTEAEEEGSIEGPLPGGAFVRWADGQRNWYPASAFGLGQYDQLYVTRKQVGTPSPEVPAAFGESPAPEPPDPATDAGEGT